MDSSNIALAKLLLSKDTYSYIPYQYINSVHFNANLLENYCYGFELVDINIRNDFLKVLYNIYVDETIDNAFILFVKTQIKLLIPIYYPMSYFITYCQTMDIHMHMLHDVTNNISLLLIKHSLHMYGRFLPRLINNMSSKNKIEIISVLGNNKENMRDFLFELKKIHKFLIITSETFFTVIIKGMKIILKFRFSAIPIEQFINNTIPIEQMYVKYNSCITYTKSYNVSTASLIDLRSYDYDIIYKKLDDYYNMTNNLNNMWQNKSLMEERIMEIFKHLPVQKRDSMYEEHY